MASHEYFEELIPIYALGGLSASERKEVEEHLRGCASCRELLATEYATVAMLPLSVEPVEPSPATKQKLFARVDADLAKQPTTLAPAPRTAVPPLTKSRRSWFSQPVFVFGVIAVLAVLLLGFWYFVQNADQRTIAGIVNDANVQRVALSGTQDAPNASATVYMVPGHSQAVLTVSGLQPLPADKGYEFWFFRDGKPVASNVFTVNSDGTMTVLVKANDQVQNFKGWGVTIEPRAGVAQPTGTLVIIGGL